MSNSIIIIYPYLDEDIWVFDDDSFGIIREPFVGGISDIINIIVKDIPNADKGFKLFFSQNPFPDYQIELVWSREEYGGNWYLWPEKNKEGWLCSALFKYFSETPMKIYCKAENLKRT